MEYKGLTIQIGGDTSELDRALRKVTKTARSTQNQLKGLDRAVKMDPTHVGAMDQKLALLGKRSEIVATQVTTLQQNIKALGSIQAKGTSKSIEELTRTTKNASLEAAKAEQAYNRVNGRLEQMYRSIKKNTGLDLHNEKEYEKIIRSQEKLGKVAKGTANEFIALKKSWEKVSNQQADMRAVASLQKQKEELARLQAQYRAFAKEEANFTAKSATDRHFANLNRKLEVTNGALRNTKGRLSELKEAFDIRPSGRAMTEYTRALKEELNTTKIKARELKQALEQPQTQEYIKLGNSVKNLGYELEQAKAKQVALREKIQEKTQLLTESPTKKQQSAIVREIKESEKALANVTAEVQRLGKADGAKRLEADLIKTEATAHKLTRTIRSVQNTDLTPFSGAKFRAVDKALESTQERLERLTQASVKGGKAVKREYGQAVKDAMSAAREKAALLNAELNKPKNKKFVELARTTDDLQLKLEKAKNKQEQLNAALDNLKIKQSTVKKGTTAFGEYEQKIQATKKALKGVNATVSDLGQAGKMRGLMDDLGRTNAQLEKMAKGPIKTISDRAFAILSMGAAYVGKRAIDMTNEIDTSFRNMSKTVEGSADELDLLKEKAKEFSLTHVTSAQQILEIEAMGGQLGVAVGELEHFAEIISQLDIATDIDATQIAQNFGQLANIKKDFDFDSAADSLVRLGNNMPTLESGIMEVATRISGVSEIVKMSTPDMLGWAAAVSSTGQQSEAGATALARTMSTVEQLVANGGKALKKGGADLSDYAKVAGMSADEFARAWREDPSKALKAFIDGLAEVDKAGGSTEKVITELGMEGVRQKTVIEALTATSENLTNALEMSKNAWEGIGDEWGEAGDAAREADKKSQGFSGSLRMLKNSAQVLGSEFGEGLAPALRYTADVVSDFAKMVNSLPSGIKTFMATAVTIAALEGVTKRAFDITPMTSFVKWSAKAIKANGSISGALANGFKAVPGLASAGYSSVKAACSGMLGSINPVGVAIAITGAALGALTYNVGKSISRQKGVAKASAGAIDELQKSMLDISSTSQDMGKKLELSSLTLDQLADRAQNSSRRTEEMAKSLQTLKNSTAEQIDELHEYVAIIEKYNEKGAKTEAEQTELNTAVKKYNELTGDSIEVLDAENGKLQKNGEELKNVKDHMSSYIKEKERMLWTEYYLEQKIKAKGDRDRKGREISQIDDEINLLSKDNDNGQYSMRISELVEQKKAMVKEFETANELIADSERHLAQVMEETVADLSEALIEVYALGKDAATKFAEHLALVGMNTSQFTALSVDKQRELKEAYDLVLQGAEGSVERYIEVLKSCGIDMSEYTYILQKEWAEGLSETDKLTLIGLAKLSKTAANGMDKLTAATGLSVAEVARTLQKGFEEGKINSSSTLDEMVAYLSQQTEEMKKNAEKDMPKVSDELKKATDGADKAVETGFANALNKQKIGQQNMLNSATAFVSSYNSKLAGLNKTGNVSYGSSGYGGSSNPFSAYRSAEYDGGAIYRTLQQRYNGSDGPLGRIYTPGMGYINEGGMASGSRAIARGPINGGARSFTSKPVAIEGTFIQRPSFSDAQHRLEQGKEAGRFIARMRQESISQISQLQSAFAEQSDRTAQEVRALRRELGQVIADNSPVRILTEREARRYIGRVTQ